MSTVTVVLGINSGQMEMDDVAKIQAAPTSFFTFFPGKFFLGRREWRLALECIKPCLSAPPKDEREVERGNDVIVCSDDRDLIIRIMRTFIIAFFWTFLLGVFD